MTASAADREPAPVRETTGLTQEEAARRLADTGPNEVTARKPVRLHRRVLAQLTDPLIMVLLGAAVLTLAIGDHPDAIVIGLVVLVNTTVGVAQEIRADNAVAALSALTAPHARVRRDGDVCDLPAASIVPGDVLLVGEGDIVAADAELAEASAVLVDESMLTGESVPVDKDSGATLSAGTVVVRGRGVAVVTATGASSALGRIAALLDERRKPTPLQRRLAALGRVLAAATLALCVLVFALGLARGSRSARWPSPPSASPWRRSPNPFPPSSPWPSLSGPGAWSPGTHWCGGCRRWRRSARYPSSPPTRPAP